MASERAYDLAVFRAERVTARLPAEQNRADEFAAHDERHDHIHLAAHELSLNLTLEARNFLTRREVRARAVRVRVGVRGVYLQKRRNFRRERLAEAARCDDTKRRGLALELCDRTAAYAQRAEDDVQSRAHHLLEVVRLRNLLAEVGERCEGVQNLAHPVRHKLACRSRVVNPELIFFAVFATTLRPLRLERAS